jgi:hypothetical protein
MKQISVKEALAALQSLSSPYSEKTSGSTWNVRSHAWNEAVISAMRTLTVAAKDEKRESAWSLLMELENPYTHVTSSDRWEISAKAWDEGITSSMLALGNAA